MKTNLEYIRAWHAALLSGKHVQGTGTLECIKRGVTTRCCLGVLCRVVMDLGVEVPFQLNYGVNGATGFGVDNDEGSLPNEVSVLVFGNDPESFYDTTDPELQYVDPDSEGSGGGSAASLNDGGHSFEKIAGYIKNTWPEAFTDV